MSTMNFNDSSGSLTSTSVRYSVLKSPYWPAIVSTALAVPEATPGPLESDVPSHGRAGGVGVLMATMFLVALMGGAGILNLPAAVAGTGWYGFPMMIALAAGVGLAGTRLSECWIILEELWPQEYCNISRSPYQSIALRAIGKKTAIFVNICLNLTLLGASVVFLLLIADMIADLLQQTEISQLNHLTSCEIVIIFTLLFLPVSWFGSPKEFWVIPIFAVAASVGTLVILIYEIGRKSPSVTPIHPVPTFKGLTLGFSSILFSLGGASTFPTIQNDMKNRDRFAHSVVIAFTCLLTMYLAICTTSYMILGDKTPPNVIDIISPESAIVVQLLLVLHFATALSITLNPALQAVEDLFNVRNGFGWGRIAIRTAVLMVLLLVALLIPKFDKILDLIGGSTISLMSFIFPPIFYMRLASKKVVNNNISEIIPTERPIRIVALWEKILLGIMIVIGTVGGVTSSYSAIHSIIQPNALNSTCFNSNYFFNEM